MNLIKNYFCFYFVFLLLIVLGCKKNSNETIITPTPITIPQPNSQEKIISVKSNTGSIVLNIALKIKKNDSLIYQGNVDSLGVLKYTLPLNVNLKFEVYKTSIGNANPIYSYNAILSNTSNFLNIVLNNIDYLFTFKGTATECSSTTPIQNGIVVLRADNNPSLEYNLPIQNGQYNSSLLLDSNTNSFVALLKVKNYNTNQIGIDTAFLATKNADNINNVKLCMNYPTLYYNFTFDNVSQLYTNANNNLSLPFLVASPSNYNGTLDRNIEVYNGNPLGTSFATSAYYVGTFIGSNVSGIYVNGNPYLWNYNLPELINISRYDLNQFGIIEGTADFYAYDFNNISHHFTASFRVRKTL
jgi:hypothetical protein